MHALSNYANTGIVIATPPEGLNADQQALNGNFVTIVNTYVPYNGATQNVNLGANGLAADGDAILLGGGLTGGSPGDGSVSFAASGLVIQGHANGVVASTGQCAITPYWFTGGTPGGVWIDLDTVGPSGIGTGGPGVNPWIAYVVQNPYWFTDSAAGDIAYRNTGGRLLFGTSEYNSQMQVNQDGSVSIGTGSYVSFPGDGSIVLQSTGGGPPATGPVAGQMYFDGTVPALYICLDGSTWTTIAG